MGCSPQVEGGHIMLNGEKTLDESMANTCTHCRHCMFRRVVGIVLGALGRVGVCEGCIVLGVS